MNCIVNMMTGKDFFVRIKDKFLDEIFPYDFSCFCCENEIVNANKYHLCEKCLDDITRIENACEKCGSELNSYTNYCDNCKSTERHFDKVYSCVKYEGGATTLIYKFKYGLCKHIARSIYPFLFDKFINSDLKENVDFITCVPISKERLKKRGFNQSELLCEMLAKDFKIDCDSKLLTRVKNTLSQAGLTKEQRLKNLKSAFALENQEKIKGKNILIVDDICTTGATLDEIAKLLKKKGAGRVYGLTFCHSGK